MRESIPSALGNVQKKHLVFQEKRHLVKYSARAESSVSSPPISLRVRFPASYLALRKKILHKNSCEMKIWMVLAVVAVVLVAGGIWAYQTYASSSTFAPTPSPASFYDLTATTLEGQSFDFSELRGKPVLIVNTASKCGFTPQYAALEKLHDDHGSDLVILGFPSNDFANQEPGSADEIGAFCERNYGVSFPMMEKVAVGGASAHPVYKWLCDATLNGVHDGAVKWNFHKFVIDADGHLRGSFRSAVKPDDKKVLNLLFPK